MTDEMVSLSGPLRWFLRLWLRFLFIAITVVLCTGLFTATCIVLYQIFLFILGYFPILGPTVGWLYRLWENCPTFYQVLQSPFIGWYVWWSCAILLLPLPPSHTTHIIMDSYDPPYARPSDFTSLTRETIKADVHDTYGKPTGIARSCGARPIKRLDSRFRTHVHRCPWLPA